MKFYRHQGKKPPLSELITANKTWRNINSTAVVNEWFENFAEANHINKTVRHKLNMVIDDLVTNIICYAFSEVADPEIEVRLELNAGAFMITFIDNGRPFNPFEQAKPDTSLSITERKVGGLGIHLSRELTDDVSYQRAEGRNIVKLIVNLPNGKND